MGVIIPQNQFNPSSLSADDLYVTIQNPPGFVKGVPTDVFGIVGTASWGPVGTAVHMGSPFDALTNFGSISAAALTDPYDLASDLSLAFGQASSQASLEGFAVRVTDGTDTAASAYVSGTASAAAITATLGGTITTGDNLKLIFTSTAVAGSPITIGYVTKAGDTLATAAAGLAAAVNGNATLAALGVAAVNASAVIDIYQPAALSPQIVVTETVTGGATETITIGSGGPTSTNGVKLSGIFTGVLGNSIQCVVQAGVKTSTYTVLLALPQIGVQESYPNLPGTNFWTALASAINNGLSGVRGPSAICRATIANNAVGTPTLQTTTLSGGTDGRAGVTTATLLGSNAAYPYTGVYALTNVMPAVGVCWLVGCTDSTATANLLAFGQTAGCTVLVAFAAGTSTATAIAAVQTNGLHDPALWYVKDWIYWFDPINNVVRFSPPTAVIGGLTCTLPPQSNPGNNPVSMVIGTERNPPSGAAIPYTDSEVGQLANAGIGFITNPIPAGSYYGIRTAQTTSLNPVTAGVEWWRMSIFLARSFVSTMGQFVDKNQSQQTNDPLRLAVKAQLNQFLSSIGGQIDSYSVICTFSSASSAVPGNGVNTPTSIAMGYLYVLVRVTYLATVRFFILSLQGGTTVVTIGATPGQQQVSS